MAYSKGGGLNACTLFFNPESGDFSGRFPGCAHLEYNVTLVSKEPMRLEVEARNVLSHKVEGSFTVSAPDVVVNPLAPKSQIVPELVSEDGRWKIRRNGRSTKAPLVLVRVHPKGDVEALGPLADLFSYEEA